MTQGKYSPEEAARILRYASLEELRKQCRADLLAVGHTADDQVEEFFLRLIRGSGSGGLSGMKLKRGHIVRPLLFEQKSQLVDYLRQLGITWCFDSSNLDRRYLRNRVRLELLPFLEENFTPAIGKTVRQSMDILAEEDKLLDVQAAAAYTDSIHLAEISKPVDCAKKPAPLVIDKKALLATHPAIRRRVLEKIFHQLGIPPNYEQIRTLLEFIESGKNGCELHLTDGVRAENFPQELRLSRPLPKGLLRGSGRPAAPINILIPGPGKYPIGATGRQLILEERDAAAGASLADGELQADLAKISFPLRLRSSLPGEKFHPRGGPGRKKISRYFNEKKIPAKQRPAWPVLLSGDKVVAIAGLQLDHFFRITSATNRILAIRWQELNAA